MSVIQVPPPVGSSGQFIDSIVITSSTNRQITVIGDPASSGALAPVTSSAGQLVSVSSGLFTLSSAPTVNVSSGTFTLSSNPTIISASSGLVQISNPTTAVSLSSNPTVISASSGLIQLTSAPLVVVATSGGTIPVSLSTVFSLSSAPLVIVATSGGTIPVSLSTVFSLSSNPTVVSASSGLIQLTSAPLVIVATSGGTIPVSLSTVFSLSSAPLVIVATSGGTIPVSLSTVVSLSSAPSVVSASSGVVQVLQSTGTAGGVTSTYLIITSVKGIKAGAGRLMGFSAWSSQVLGFWLQVYDNTSGNVTVGTSMIGAFPTGSVSTAAANTWPPYWFGPNGINFSSGLSVAPSVTASGAVVATSATNGTTVGVYLTMYYV